MWKAILIFGAVFTTPAIADEVPEPQISVTDKLQIEKTLQEFRSGGSITQSEYEESIALLNDRPCDGIDRSLSKVERSEFSSRISRIPYLQGARITQSFRDHSWRILTDDSPNSDEAFLFFPQDPRVSEPVAIWGGANGIPEGPDLVKWELENAPGIPESLARCFAWHVTFNRDQ